MKPGRIFRGAPLEIDLDIPGAAKAKIADLGGVGLDIPAIIYTCEHMIEFKFGQPVVVGGAVCKIEELCECRCNPQFFL